MRRHLAGWLRRMANRLDPNPRTLHVRLTADSAAFRKATEDVVRRLSRLERIG